MKSFLTLLIAFVALACKDSTNRSGIPGRSLDFKYSLEVPSAYKVEDYTSQYAAWTASLIKNLGYKRSKISCLEFLRTDISLLKKGAPTSGAIYVCRTNDRLFYSAELGLLIDFEKELVGTGGTSGMSKHFTNDRKLCAILHPQAGEWVYGVVLGDSKTEHGKPVFKGPAWVEFEYN